MTSRTAREERLVFGLGPAHHFPQIVSRTEDGARRAQDHDPRGAVRGDPLQCRPKFGQHGLGQRISPLGPIQRQPDHAGLGFHKQHFAYSNGNQPRRPRVGGGIFQLEYLDHLPTFVKGGPGDQSLHTARSSRTIARFLKHKTFEEKHDHIPFFDSFCDCPRFPCPREPPGKRRFPTGISWVERLVDADAGWKNLLGCASTAWRRQAARIEHAGIGDWSLAQQRMLEVKPGQIYELSGWVRVQGRGDATLCVTLRDAGDKVTDWVFAG